jgi:hypothetical protein
MCHFFLANKREMMSFLKEQYYYTKIKFMILSEMKEWNKESGGTKNKTFSLPLFNARKINMIGGGGKVRDLEICDIFSC